MTHGIYTDTKYLLQVARVNGLGTIRKLKPGVTLAFPPLEKAGETDKVASAKHSLTPE
jgi:hypothetical protein